MRERLLCYLGIIRIKLAHNTKRDVENSSSFMDVRIFSKYHRHFKENISDSSCFHSESFGDVALRWISCCPRSWGGCIFIKHN